MHCYRQPLQHSCLGRPAYTWHLCCVVFVLSCKRNQRQEPSESGHSASDAAIYCVILPLLSLAYFSSLHFLFLDDDFYLYLPHLHASTLLLHGAALHPTHRISCREVLRRDTLTSKHQNQRHAQGRAAKL
jgi:hypothetical protein